MKTHVNQKLRKTDVNNLWACGEGWESALAGARLEQQAPDLIGWLIYRSDTDEFFSLQALLGYSTRSYVKNPEFAFCFSTEQLAFRYSTFIEKETEVVPLFDLGGDKLAVGFS